MKLFKKKGNETMKEEMIAKEADWKTVSEGLPMEKTQKKVMISQPMRGKTDEEIKETREKAIATLESKGYQVVNTLFTDEWYSKEAMEGRGVVQIPVCFLSKSIENMSLCHAAYFCDGWEDARGCRIEHDIAEAYGLEIMYESEPEGKPECIMLTREDFHSNKEDAIKAFKKKVEHVLEMSAEMKGDKDDLFRKHLFMTSELVTAHTFAMLIEKQLFGSKE